MMDRLTRRQKGGEKVNALQTGSTIEISSFNSYHEQFNSYLDANNNFFAGCKDDYLGWGNP